MKLLLLAAVIGIVYFLFFKEKSIAVTKPKASNAPKDSEDTVECSKCGVFVAVSEALIKEGRYYCSIECLEA